MGDIFQLTTADISSSSPLKGVLSSSTVENERNRASQ